ncbi:MAG: hypothetical protein NVSMB6_18210 [Burkholderiaceae bacterium]
MLSRCTLATDFDVYLQPEIYQAKSETMVATVDCPTCGKKVEWVEVSKYRPFCCLRCKQIDLGSWAEEKYVIPAVSPLQEFDEDGVVRPK